MKRFKKAVLLLLALFVVSGCRSQEFVVADSQQLGNGATGTTEPPPASGSPPDSTTPPPGSSIDPVYPPSSQQFTFDEILPDPFTAFVPLNAGQKVLGNVHRDPRTGAAGSPGFPASWNILQPNTSVRLKVLVPPGVNLVSWYVEAANLVAYLGACDQQGNCREGSYSPTLWPVGYNSQAPGATPVDSLPGVTTPRIVYLTVRALSIDFWFLSLTVSYNVQDPVAYENWRAARSWAGGPGDCDGLGGLYCR